MAYYNNIKNLLEKCVTKYCDLNAFKFTINGVLSIKSYQDFLTDVYRAVSYIEHDISLHKHIALAGYNTYSWIVLFYAITISGRVAVLPNTNLNLDEFCEELDMADAAFLLCDKKFLDQAENITASCKKLMGIQDINAWLSHKNNEVCLPDIRNNQPAAILFTSGTSAKPKPVLLSHENIAGNASCTELGVWEDNFCSVLPNYHIFSLTINVMWPFTSGFCLCLCEKDQNYLRDLNKYNVLFTSVVPAMLKPLARMLEANSSYGKRKAAIKLFGPSLKYIAVGGAFVDPFYVDYFEDYGIHLRAGYGLTETSSIISMNTGLVNKSGSVGKVQPFCDIKFVNDEIFVKGPNVMLGYYKMPQKTSEVLNNGWFATGDLGYIDKEGFLYITGRKKNVIVTSNGENVSPEQIESYFCLNKLVQRAHAYQKDDKIFVDLKIENSAGKNIIGLAEKLRQEYNKKQPAFKKVFKINIK